MKRFILASFASLVGVGALAVGTASAQSVIPYRAPAYGPGFQPQLSPYLNFLRGGDPAANYYLGVVPEFQRRQDRVLLGSNIAGLEERYSEVEDELRPGEALMPRLPATGHATVFNNTGSYFSQPRLRPGFRPPTSTYRRR